MKIFQVGGSIRDELLGLPVVDRDWVVVGASPQQMIDAGFKPVGRDFPVFLHPDTHEEYALARTERKTAPGYSGFSFHSAPDVTLEQDLARRDFTINAMARDAAGTHGAPIVDPYGGQADLRAGILRHVGPAFAEDPVRILRGARFVARFGFAVAPETLELMRAMVVAGEADALVPERVWQEISRGLMEPSPIAMFELLAACGALDRIAPELTPFHPEASSMRMLQAAARMGFSLERRYAALCAGLAQASADSLSARLRVPSDCRDLARLASRHRAQLMESSVLDAAQLVDLVRDCDGFRQPQRFAALIDVAVAVSEVSAAAGQSGLSRERLAVALDAARTVDAGAIAARASSPAGIQADLRAARVAAVAAALARAHQSFGP